MGQQPTATKTRPQRRPLRAYPVPARRTQDGPPSTRELLLRFEAEGNQEHPAGTCTWCGGDPIAYDAEGLPWCLAHCPESLL